MEEDCFTRATKVRPVGLGLSKDRLCGLGRSLGAFVRPLLLLLAVLPAGRAQAPFLVPAVAEAAQAPNPVERIAYALKRCRANLPEDDRWEIAGVVHRESQRYGYDPYFVLAMMEVESTCTPTAKGTNGGVGLIQVTVSTGRAMAREAGLKFRGPKDLTEPAINVHLGLRYLSILERQFRDPYVAMAAYNMGPGRVSQMSRSRARGARYVRKILHRYEAILDHVEA
jgi:soluble lytic murein transglycosylase-like protein